MPLRDFVSANPIAKTAANDAERAETLANEAADPGLMGVAQVVAIVALTEAVLSLEVQIDRIVSRLEAAA